ncbi:NUDIX domain-containing protein [Brevibacillus borstelensis]|uniref:NUDIX domain-containing protein n=1 Tax=Brevibacillus borstelensis TaxID=45462 RepID=UPI0030C1204E
MAWYHLLVRRYWRLRKPLTLGVRIIVTDEDKGVLLVRHTYVKGWYLPGGGVERGESFADAARRELWEECGAEAESLSLCHLYYSEREGKRDYIALFHAGQYRLHERDGSDPEVAEMRFFSWDELPEELTPATSRRLREFCRRQFTTDRW